MIRNIENLVNICYPAIVHDAHVTNRMFVYIRSNQNILDQYQHLCQIYSVGTVNRWIGRLIKTTYHLPNSGQATATSSLIKTYTLH
jgi:hypothetical protein